MTTQAIRYRKVGGIWFLRLWRVQLSFCLCRKSARTQADPVRFYREYPGGSIVQVYHDR